MCGLKEVKYNGTKEELIQLINTSKNSGLEMIELVGYTLGSFGTNYITCTDGMVKWTDYRT